MTEKFLGVALLDPFHNAAKNLLACSAEGTTIFSMKTLLRRFIQAGVALLFLAAAPLPVQAWAPKKPAHKEYKDPLSVYQKALSSGLSTLRASERSPAIAALAVSSS